MYQSNSVVDSSYIDRRFQFIGIIGRGRDNIFDLTSTINLVRERSQTFKEDNNVDDGEGKNYALQIYHSMSLAVFQKKVIQIQSAMTEYVTNLHTRIILLGQNKINNSTYELFVVYDVDYLMDKTLAQEIQIRKNEKPEDKFKLFDQEEAQELLSFLAQNLLLQGRYTSEFLDISPQNILMNSQDLPQHTKYVISNFGIGYQGTKFYRRYTCPSDPFFDEPFNEKSIPQIIFTYAFQAALVTLQCMLGFDSKDMFREDKLNEVQLINLVNFITITKQSEGQGDTKEQQEQKDKGSKYEKRKEEIYRNFPSINRKLELPQITYEFSEILKKLFSTDQPKRSIFLSMIQYPNNLFDLEFPLLSRKESWVVPGVLIPENRGVYVGMGKSLITEEDSKEETFKKQMDQRQTTAIQEGCGQCMYQGKEYNRYGCWKNGVPFGIGCLEIKQENQITYITGIWDSPIIVRETIVHVLDKYVYYGPLDQNFLPHGEGRVIKVNPMNIQLRPTRIQVFAEGTLDHGVMGEGKIWFKDGNFYDGTLLENSPLKGIMFYKEIGHKFDGDFVRGQRVFGTLHYPNGVTFDGDFENDQIKLGMLLYPDIATYEGNFKNNMKRIKIIQLQIDGTGLYTYADDSMRYDGNFKRNQMNGLGKLIVKKEDGTDQIFPIQYDNGKLLTALPIEIMIKLQKKKEIYEVYTKDTQLKPQEQETYRPSDDFKQPQATAKNVDDKPGQVEPIKDSNKNPTSKLTEENKMPQTTLKADDGKQSIKSDNKVENVQPSEKLENRIKSDSQDNKPRKIEQKQKLSDQENDKGQEPNKKITSQLNEPVQDDQIREKKSSQQIKKDKSEPQIIEHDEDNEPSLEDGAPEDQNEIQESESLKSLERKKASQGPAEQKGSKQSKRPQQTKEGKQKNDPAVK